MTGAAQGFGEGIARCLIQQGANIVVADLNEAVGAATAERLNGMARSNRAIFVKTNVADTESLRNLIHETVCRFGGLDVFVSNAGVAARRRVGGDDSGKLRVRHAKSTTTPTSTALRPHRA